MSLTRDEPPPLAWGRITAGMALATCSTLLLEIVITRLFSVVLIYHFAFMAISIALFGLGLAGIVVYAFPERFPRAGVPAIAAWSSLAFAATTVLALAAFSGILRAADDWPLGFGTVAAMFLVMAVPFFCSGLTITVVLARCPERIGMLYGADLAGAAAGAALTVPLLGLLGGPMTVVVAAVLASGAALCFATAASRRPRWAAALGLVAAAALLAWGTGADLFALRHSRGGPEKRRMFERWNSFSRVSVHGPWHYGCGLHVGYGARLPAPLPDGRNAFPTHATILIDGGAETQMPHFRGNYGEIDYFRYDVTSLGYQARRARTALIIGGGGGRDILTARLLGVESVRVVEVNPLIVHVVRERFGDFSGDPYGQPGVEVEITDGRSFAATSGETFDVVQLVAVDTFAASGGGALALVEHSLYTLEAFEDYYDRLAPDGLLAITHQWGVESPERALRTVDLVRRAWGARGHEDVSRHVIVVGRRRPWGTLLASRRPFDEREIDHMTRLARGLGFGLLYAPGAPESLPGIRALLGPEPERFLARHPVDVSATTDDRPFFFFFSRPSEFFSRGVTGLFRAPEMASGFEAEGYAPTLLVRLLFWMAVLTALLIFGLPMLLGRLRLSAARGVGRHLAYFACIGLGFIVIEIPLLHRFTLMLGQPVYAFAVILAGILVSGGIGSLISGRIADGRLGRSARLAAAAVIAGTLLHVLLGGALVQAGLHWPLPARLVATLISIAPLGLVMGMPLPLGMRALARRAPDAVAWGWGVNGSLSVLGTVLAMVISVTAGGSGALLFGAACYAGALLAADPSS